MIPGDSFTPRWASPPGSTIRDILRERRISLGAFATTLHISIAKAESILDGSEPITVDLARRLATSVGASLEFWITRDCQYRDDLARKTLANWADALPLSEIAAFGWIRQPTGWKERITSALEFFGVPDLDTWSSNYTSRLAQAHYRFASSARVKKSSLAVWVRKGELEARSIPCQDWNPEALRDCLPELRGLTRRRTPSEFLPRLTQLGAAAGVAITVVRAPRGCSVSGLARFLSSSLAHISLTARYLSDDHFWFTLFHEIAHLLLHDPHTVFVDEIDRQRRTAAGDRLEAEADEFAGRTLLPLDYRLGIPRRPKARDLIRVARQAGTTPGIVVGQLQHDGQLGYATTLNGLKRRYKWVGI